MGTFRQFGMLIALLLGLAVALLGGFYIIGPLMLGSGSPTRTSGGSQIQNTATLATGLSPTQVYRPTPYSTPVPTPSPLPTLASTPFPLPSLAPTLTSTPFPLPSLAPIQTPTSVATATQTNTTIAGAEITVSPDDVTVPVTDEGITGIVVAPTSLTLSEPEGSGTITITLDSEPLAPVSIALSPSSDECLVSPGEVTLDSDNWRAGVGVTVLAGDDAVDDGEQSCVVEARAATNNGPDYDEMVPDYVAVTVADDDTAGIAIAPLSLTLSEPEGSGTFTITLDSEPLAPVSIALSPSSDECSVSPNEVALDSDNWRVGVGVAVLAEDDAVDDGEQSCVVEAGAATSTGADYNEMVAGVVAVTVADDDTAGIAIAPLSLALSEPEGSGTFTITLDSEPLAPVSIALSPSSDECSVSPAAVTLDSDNWRVGVGVAVLAEDDAVDDGEQSCVVEGGTATSSGADYNEMLAGDVAVTVADDDTAGIAIAPLSLTLSEPEGSGTFTITLDSEPLAPVSIALSPSSDECSVSPAAVTLDSDNWRVGVAVAVLAEDDAVDDGEQSCEVEAGAATSSGADYNEMVAGDVAVTVADDDTAGITIAPVNLTLSEPEGSSTFTITLSSEPTDTVAISLTADGQAVVSPTLLTFTHLNWSVQQPVVVSAVDDDFAESMHSSTISHSVSSNDGNYDGAAIDNVTAHIADDDSVGVAVTPADIQVAEGGPPQSYQIVLSSQPTDAVTISITTDGQITVHPALLTFAELKWNVPQTVTVTAVDDDVVEGPHPSTISHLGKSDDTGYLDLAIPDVAAQVTDNDAAGTVLTATQEITESPSVELDFGELGGQLSEVFATITEQPIRINPLFILLVLVVVVVVIVQLVFGRRRR